MSKDKPHNGGQWTKARFFSFVKGSLRGASVRWPPRYGALATAFRKRAVNPKTGRVAKLYECASCHDLFSNSDVEVNHKEPVIPISGFDSWDGVIKRMFCEEDGLEVLCKPCHKEVTKKENEERKKYE